MLQILTLTVAQVWRGRRLCVLLVLTSPGWCLVVLGEEACAVVKVGLVLL